MKNRNYDFSMSEIGLISEERFIRQRNESIERLKSFEEQESIHLDEDVLKRSCMDNVYDKKLNPNAIVVLGLGKGARGNLFYILNELNHNPRYSHFTIYIRTSPETDDIVKDFIRNNHWDQTHTCVDGDRYAVVLETSKYLLTEVFFPDTWFKREGQIVINIWHGTPLKKLGQAKMSINKFADGVTQKNFISTDYLLYPNAYTRDNMLTSYRVNNLLQGKIIMGGYPRTGAIMDQSHNEETLRELAPNGETIYAYMPTWKDYLKLEQVLAESRELLDYMDEHLRDDQILYVNLHHKVSDQLDYSKYNHIRHFPANVDSYRLQAATDALITDYSSVFFDYCASGKNIILYCPDLELYEKKRGTYMDMRELPFWKAVSPAEVMDALQNGKTYDDSAFFKEFCQYDDTENAARLCKLLVGDESEYQTSLPIKDARKRVLFYEDGMTQNDKTSLFVKYASGYHKDTIDLYLSGDAIEIKQNYKTAKPVLEATAENNVIGVKADCRISKYGKISKALYGKGIISFDDAFECMKYDYALEFKRFFGTNAFDMVIIYKAFDADRLMSLLMSGKPTVLFLNRKMLKQIQKERKECKKNNQNPIYGTCIKYWIEKTGACVAESAKDALFARIVLGLSFRHEIKIINSTAKMNKLIENS